MRRPSASEPVATGSGRGKIILLGEHSVVHGQPAIVAGLDLETRVRLLARPEAGPPWICAPCWSVDRVAAGQDTLDRAVRSMVQRYAGADDGLRIEVESQLPAGVGLGSSAALSVALARALLTRRSRQQPALAEVEELAAVGERCFHGRPSGVDVAAAARGGLLWFRGGRAPTALTLPSPLPLLLLTTSPGPSTAQMVARVAARLRDRPAHTEELLHRLGELTRSARARLEQLDRAALGALLTQAHDTLARLGVSSSDLDRAVTDALEAGALGAKLSGAGGGGVALVLLGADADPVEERLRSKGWTPLRCAVG